MKINRKELLDKLNVVIGAANKSEMLEQSNCFVFSDNLIMTFNGEMFAATAFPFEEKFAVNAFDFLQLLSKVSDDELNIEYKDNQLSISGNRKRAGLVTQQEILLPVDEVPHPERMKKVKEGFLEALQMAAKICDIKSDNYRVSHVHVTRDKIEATDRYRLFRMQVDTGSDEMLVPATAILSINNINVTHIEMVNGWLFMKDAESKVMVAVCCAEGEYFESSVLDKILEMKDASTILLPDEMKDVIARSTIMAGDDCEKEAQITLSKATLTIKTEKDSGWYEEKQKVKYKGNDLKMNVNLSLLKDILSKTRKAIITNGKIKMEKDGVEFMVALEK